MSMSADALILSACARERTVAIHLDAQPLTCRCIFEEMPRRSETVSPGKEHDFCARREDGYSMQLWGDVELLPLLFVGDQRAVLVPVELHVSHVDRDLHEPYVCKLRKLVRVVLHDVFD